MSTLRTIDVTLAAERYWLDPRDRWEVTEYGDLTLPWPAARVVWRVPSLVNLGGKLVANPLGERWTALVERSDPKVALARPWREIEEGLARTAEHSAELARRGASPETRAQLELLAAAARGPVTPELGRRVLALLESARCGVLARLKVPLAPPGLFVLGEAAFWVGADGRARPESLVYTALAHPWLGADQLGAVATFVEIGVHPLLVAVDALNRGTGRLVQRGGRERFEFVASRVG
ncbi:MAG: hypothetical protein M9894_09625 [Planctomycetes bacterium]|nr:hypothetical protein [Planctomycetota bacterium]